MNIMNIIFKFFKKFISILSFSALQSILPLSYWSFFKNFSTEHLLREKYEYCASGTIPPNLLKFYTHPFWSNITCILNFIKIGDWE